MARARCQAMVRSRPYSEGGQCEKRSGVKPVVIVEGGDRVRAKLCVPHRKVLEAHKPIELAA